MELPASPNRFNGGFIRGLDRLPEEFGGVRERDPYQLLYVRAHSSTVELYCGEGGLSDGLPLPKSLI